MNPSQLQIWVAQCVCVCVTPPPRKIATNPPVKPKALNNLAEDPPVNVQIREGLFRQASIVRAYPRTLSRFLSMRGRGSSH